MGRAVSGLGNRPELVIAEELSGEYATRRKKMAVTSVLAAMALVVLDAAMVNVALPPIAKSLFITPGKAVEVVTAYQLGLVVALLPTAALGESLGYRRVFRFGVMLFTAASMACALAPSFGWLVTARFFQGLGGAAVMALGVALLRQIVAPSQLGAAIGWNALTVALSSAAGPAVGALAVSMSSWQWLFVATQPLAVAVLAISRVLPDVVGNGRRIDIVSVFLNAVCFGALVAACENLQSRPMLSVVLLVATGGALFFLIRRELPQQMPLIPLDLLRSLSFRVSVVASVCGFAGQTAGLIALPFYLQNNFHLSIFITGLLITPWPLTVALIAPIAGRAANYISDAALCAAGGLILAIGLAGAALWSVTDPLWLVPFISLCGFGFGLFQVANNRNMFLSAPQERSGAAGGIQGTARLTGQTIGAVILTLLFASYASDDVPRIAMAIGAILTLTAGVVNVQRFPKREVR